MLQKERFDEIYEILKERNSATVQYLQKRLYVSEATVRRDLEAMEKAGLIERVWGGAILPSVGRDIPSFVRQKTNQDKKEKISSIAAGFLKNSCTVFFDSSTTCLSMVPYFSELKNVTVITSSLKMSYRLGEQGSTAINLLGGQIYEGYILTGHMAVESVRRFHTDLMFFSCSGISAAAGLTSVEPKVVEVVQQMMKNAEKKILLCDSSKFGKQLLWHLADIEDVSYIISDAKPNDSALAAALASKLITSEN